MAAEDEKKEKEKDGKKEIVKEKVEEVINAVYRVNLHCQQCARDIQKPLMRTQGVHAVDADFEKGELKVKGAIDPIKMQKRIEKLSKKKVVLISPIVKAKESVPIEKKAKETKEPIVSTTSVKVHMHCDKCEQDLKKKLLMHKGIHSVKTDMKAQTLTVGGTIEPDKLLSYLKKKVHKHAEIISSKQAEKKEEKKVEKKEEKKVEKKEEKKEKDDQKVEGKPKEKPTEKAGDGKPSSTTESTKIIEVHKEDTKVVEVKAKEANAPYFIHYVYAPQLFSDENPNACSVM